MKHLNLFLFSLIVLLAACGGGGEEAALPEENPLSGERPFAIAILEVQSVTEYPGDGDREIVAEEGRKFALVRLASEAYADGNFWPGDMVYRAINGAETYAESWAHRDKLTYDTNMRNQYGNALGNGWLVFDVPQDVASFELIVSGPDANRATTLEYIRRPITLP